MAIGANDSQNFLMINFPKCEDHYSEFLIVQGFPLLFHSLTCRQQQFITVLGASWWSQCARIQPGNNIQWYILKVRISSRLRTPIDNHTLIVVYSMPVKCPGYKVSNVQQFYSILSQMPKMFKCTSPCNPSGCSVIFVEMPAFLNDAEKDTRLDQ